MRFAQQPFQFPDLVSQQRSLLEFKVVGRSGHSFVKSSWPGKAGLAQRPNLKEDSLVQLTLPAPLEAKLTPQQAALRLAIGMFVADEATLGQAAEIAGLSQADFLKELGKRRIPIHYGPAELAEDLQAVESLSGG